MPYNLEIAHSVTPQAGRRAELSIAANSAQVLLRGKPEYDVPHEVIPHINRLFESALDKRISSKPTRDQHFGPGTAEARSKSAASWIDPG